MRKLLCFILIIVSFVGYSQTNNALPWVKGKLPDNSKMINYKVVQGEGQQLPEAQNNALKNLLFDLGAEKGVTVSSKTILNTQEKIAKEKTSFNSEYSKTITIDQEGFNVSFCKVDEYYEKVKENGQVIYRCWQLYSIGTKNIKKPEYTTHYGFGAGARSLVVPGWGQFYKKQNGKGFVFLSMEAIAVGNIIFAQSRYNYNTNRIEESASLEVQKEYKTRADDNLMYRNISIGVGVATLIWSVIDASATEGAPKYAMKTSNLKMQLFTCQETPIMIGLKYRF